jgi:SAM-dependent methyltransferase
VSVAAGQDDVTDAGLSFGSVARAYELVRPTYPGEVVEWLVPRGVHRIIDLGAGTGKFARALVDRGLDVVGVEPSAGMRETFANAVGGATVIAGSAEDIPLEDASVDAVVVAQAWHWVDSTRAVPEVARILRPGGSLGLVWNTRDEGEAWVAALSALFAEYAVTNELAGEPEVGPPFGPLDHYALRWRHPMTAEEIVDLFASRSYLITLPPDERAEALQQVRTLVMTHPDTAGRQQSNMPYVTRAFRAELP